MLEDLGYDYLSNNLMRFHAKKMFFKATLAFLILEDDIGASKQLEKYLEDDPSFNNSFEGKFLKGII